MNTDGLDELALDEALKKMPAKEISVLAYKGLLRHQASCDESQKKLLTFVKGVFVIVGVLALERLGEILHIPYLSTLVTHVTGTGV